MAGTKIKVLSVLFVIILLITGFLFFRYFFTFEQRQQFQRKIDTVTGQNLTVTVFGFDGKIIKRWVGIQKITSGYTRPSSGERTYTFFYTREGKYVQIPDSVWYIAEEE
ncbi:MAG TPA: hypothetical protein PLA65_06010 [Spirochaetota bacterium]|nr:hypothetical protein [Spirochaetota bacterium]HPG51139.1 hypothetical protein [Spirochaetota bacterium]HPN11593.1 hypothetical protein [Spirochaetota bacterium]